nr:pyridoxamine 5'-phosphate oxidase family protein [Streptomyces sp. AC512_CC834]
MTTTPRFDPRALLAGSRLGVLATIKSDGRPQLSPVMPAQCPGRQRLPVKERRPVRALGVLAGSPRTGCTWAFGRCGESACRASRRGERCLLGR